MDKEKLIKLLETDSRTSDNIIGKMLLLKYYPEIKKSLTDSSIGHTKNVKIQLIERDCGIVLPYKKRHGNVLTFYRTDFPELWEND